MRGLFILAAVIAVVSADHCPVKQQVINQLLSRVADPIDDAFTSLKEAASTWNPSDNMDKCKDDGASMKALLKEIEDERVLGKHEIFSLFNDRHRAEAIMFIDVLMNCVDFDTFKANAAYFREKLNENEFVYALYVAVSHSDLTQEIVLPPLYEVTPHLFTNTEIIHKAISAQMTQTPGKFRMEFTGSLKNPEQRVAYFGEDVGLNSHHVHWHMDFPFWWDGYQMDRKGELFFWVHHQLTARFDAERLSNYLNPVEELYWNRPIAEGFAPHTAYRYGGEFPNRPDNKYFEDVDGAGRVRDMLIIEDRIIDAIDHGYIIDADGKQIDLDVEHGIDILGNIIESSTYSPNVQYYGSLHNSAHKILGRQVDPKGKFNLPPGVMEHFETATRDPSFFRLHKYMNGIFKSYKDSLPSYTEEELGYSNVEITSVGIEGELTTFFEDFEIDLRHGLDRSEGSEDIEVSAVMSRLNHKDFAFNIKLNANSAETATFRIFLCPKYDNNGIEFTLEEGRWGCIQVDKFWKDLEAGENEIVRKSTDASVAIPDRPSFQELITKADAAIEAGEELDIDTVRSCGLPQRLLLPKGNKQGMDFELFVSVTSGDDAAVDNLTTDVKGGSYSYCGFRGEKYPDKRAMGYPLDRKVTDDRIFQIPNIKWETVKIFFSED